MKGFILVCFSVLLLTGCVSWFAGGADYRYTRHDPSTNATTAVTVHSTREFGSAHVHFGTNGTVDIDVRDAKSGADNLGTALGIIGTFTKAAIVP